MLSNKQGLIEMGVSERKLNEIDDAVRSKLHSLADGYETSLSDEAEDYIMEAFFGRVKAYRGRTDIDTLHESVVGKNRPTGRAEVMFVLGYITHRDETPSEVSRFASTVYAASKSEEMGDR